MANTDITTQKIKAKISAIKKINDNPKSLIETVFEKYKDDLSSTDGVVKKKITDFTSKAKGGTENKKNIFGEIIDIAEGFLGTNKEDPTNPKKKPLVKSKILSYAKQSAAKTIQGSKQIIIDEVKKSFFEGQGACSSDTTFGSTSLTLSPKNFDFLNVLKVDPDSTTGKLMYENTTNAGLGDIKFNRKLYENFDLISPPYNFNTKDGNLLFALSWNSGTQLYTVSGLDSAGKITDFLDDYYNTIEYPNIEDVIKNAMSMTLQGDGTESTSFKDGMNSVNRLCTKLFSLCGKPKKSQPLKNNTNDQLEEDEIDIQNYFDFDNLEGIDLDDEDARNRRVLKFRDCDNFEVPINSNHIEDFAYLLTSKILDENVNNTLNKASSDAYEQSGGSIPFDGFQLSLTSAYILKIPKAIISSVLSPKMFFPIAVVYKQLKGNISTAKELMKSLSNLFFKIIKKLFWTFIKEFWKYLKRDLLIFVRDTAAKIIMNKLKKLKAIISILINILTKILETNIGSCTEIFNAILNAITAAMNKKVSVPIPSMLLSMSDLLPGYSSDRAYMNVMEKIESSGINTGPIYGTENKFPSVIKAILDGHDEEMDANSYVSIGLKTTTIAANGTNAYITPLVAGAGKVF